METKEELLEIIDFLYAMNPGPECDRSWCEAAMGMGPGACEHLASCRHRVEIAERLLELKTKIRHTPCISEVLS